MKIMYIQYGGDFGKAYDNLNAGHNENYYGQKYSVDAVVNQAREGNELYIITCRADINSDRILEKGLQVIGIDQNIEGWRSIVIESIRKVSPDRAILRLPDWRLLKFLRKMNINVFPVLADSFEHHISWLKLKSQLGHFLLKSELKHPTIQWVANHQLNAAKSIEKLGVDPAKILPYDWEHNQCPTDWKPHINTHLIDGELTLLFVGSLIETKGIGDIIKSLKYILIMGRKANLRIIGKGDKKSFEILSQDEGVSENITFLGSIENDRVRHEMNIADVVIVPSHHTYPEGLPMTIMESLLVQTPLVVSDHPMFVGRLITGSAIEIFDEKEPEQLAEKVILICSDKTKYIERCKNATKEWENLTLDLKWAEMINRWLEDDDTFLADHSLKKLEFS